LSSTQGTPASQPLRYPRSLVDHAHHSKHNTNLLQQNRLAGDMYRQALPLLDRLAGDTYCNIPKEYYEFLINKNRKED